MPTVGTAPSADETQVLILAVHCNHPFLTSLYATWRFWDSLQWTPKSGAVVAGTVPGAGDVYDCVCLKRCGCKDKSSTPSQKVVHISEFDSKVQISVIISHILRSKHSSNFTYFASESDIFLAEWVHLLWWQVSQDMGGGERPGSGQGSDVFSFVWTPVQLCALYNLGSSRLYGKLVRLHPISNWIVLVPVEVTRHSKISQTSKERSKQIAVLNVSCPTGKSTCLHWKKQVTNGLSFQCN